MGRYELPDRSHLKGQEVKVRCYGWPLVRPVRGIFLGQGETGMSIRVRGGGRMVLSHREVKSVKPL